MVVRDATPASVFLVEKQPERSLKRSTLKCHRSNVAVVSLLNCVVSRPGKVKEQVRTHAIETPPAMSFGDMKPFRVPLFRALCLLLTGACQSPRVSSVPRPIPSTPISSTGPMARRFLRTPGFTWHSFESAHTRLHLAGEMSVERVSQLADSAERARRVALALLDERSIANEPPLEIVFVESRADMQRLAGQPAGGSAFPGELTAVLVAGIDYRPFFRHELTHAYAAHRWGKRQGGSWLDEGLAALATGACQGHSVDAVAAGFAAVGDSPTLEQLSGDFYAIPELPGYFTAASLVNFLKHREGTGALRSIWNGSRAGVDQFHPLGHDTARLWWEWRQHLADVVPARLDTARLRRDGC